MADILKRIAAHKAAILRATPRLALPSRPMSRKFSQALAGSPTGIIAEFKRRSPSKGEIHPCALPEEVIPAYESGGATCCSVLTDTPYFGGSLSDLAVARSVTTLPLLRKDFVIEETQIAEAALAGAEAVLLIAALLERKRVEELTAAAHEAGLEVLFEIHSERELERFTESVDMIGVNNRDLTTFNTDPTLSEKVADALPENIVKVAESGLTSFEEVRRLRSLGYRGFLIGETFMRAASPGDALRDFLDGKTL